MLLELHVRNFALIEQADIDFSGGMTVLSGETGAGKSILIDSISAALGAKTGHEVIRTGTDHAYIELLFQVKEDAVREKIAALGFQTEADGTLILSRKILPNRSVLRVNDEAVTAAKLRTLEGLLLNIHGQNEHQTLLYPEYHLAYVDGMAPEALAPLLSENRIKYGRWLELRNLLKKEADDSFRAREKEILLYETEEIRNAALKEGEEEALRAEFLKMRNAERIRSALSAAGESLDTDAVSEAVRRVSSAAEYAPELAELRDQLAELDSLLSDAARSVADALDNTSCDDEELMRITERLDLIRRLEDKYGEDVPGILRLLKEKEERLLFLDTFEAKRADMTAEKRKLEEELKKLAEKISSIRRKTAAGLAEKTAAELSALNFNGAVFEVRVSPNGEFGPDGADRAEFYISTNPGEPPKPLKAVASGGEMSRIMLALKSVLADRDDTETLIFDEIDTGISGRTAQMVAERLGMLGQRRQVLCISHLPQIAAMADHNLLIRKETDGQRTRTDIREIGGKEITEELARMLGGTEITEGVLRTAEEMKRLAEERKKRA